MKLENSVFSKAESSQISDKYTAVRLLGGDDMTEEGEAFYARYGLPGFPSMLAMTPDGHVIGRNLARSLQGILDDMAKAADGNEAFKKTLAELKDKRDADSVRTLAGLYRDRAQYDEARTRYETLTKSEPTVEDQLALLGIYDMQGEDDAAKELLDVLVKTRTDHASHIQWRIRQATWGLPVRFSSAQERAELLTKHIAALKGLLPTVEKSDDQATVRGMLANYLAGSGDREAATEHWDWILANAPKSEAAPGALGSKGNMLIMAGRMAQDPAKIAEGKALWEQLIKDYPESGPARQAKQYMGIIENMIAQLEAKKQAEEDAKKKAEEEKKADEEPKPEPDPATPDK